MNNTRIIDTTKCMRCGKCVDDCVNNYLILTNTEEGERFVTFDPKGRCIECGHCNAICPVGAVAGGSLEPIMDGADDLISMMGRKRTVRRYIKDSIIANKDLEMILLAGQSAPTDRNRKSARIILVKEKLRELYYMALDKLVEEVSQVGSINPLYRSVMRMNEKREEVLWNAEYLVVLAGRTQSSVDAAIAAERMQLEAFNLGIGSAYRGDIQHAINTVTNIREMLGIKNYEEALISFAMGKSEQVYLRPAVKANRRVIYM